MTLMHPSSIGAPVALWFVNGMPARLIHAGKRYRVVDTARPIESGWAFRARADSGEEHNFEVQVTREGWELARAS